MRSTEEIKDRIERWQKIKFAEYHQEPIGTAILELKWVLGNSFDILAENERVRREEWNTHIAGTMN